MSVGQAPPSIDRPRRVRKLLIVELVVLAAIARACVLRPSTDHPGSHFNSGRNAAWLGVEWSMEPHSVAQVDALARELLAEQISIVFVYVSYLKPHGVFNPTYDHAAEFVSTVKAIAPDLEVQAWLGVPLKVPDGTPIESGYVELNDATTRATIVDFARFAVHELNFDGVHLDAEPLVSGEPYALILLDELRAALGPQVHLSISASHITPLFPDADLIINRWFTWRADYYREVAARVDQIALMAYDSHAPIGWLYQQWMRFQVIALSSSLRDAHVEIFVGVPTSEEHTPAHNPAVENVENGLRGLLAGLNDLDALPDMITGVAIYPYWETGADEWATYRALWLGDE